MTVLDNLKAAMYAEKQMASQYAKYAIDCQDPQVKALFQQMSSSAKRNAQQLQNRINQIADNYEQ